MGRKGNKEIRGIYQSRNKEHRPQGGALIPEFFKIKTEIPNSAEPDPETSSG